jgi:hypothetical protein
LLRDERREARVNLEITEQERNLLLQLIENAESAAIQSMDHADSRAFKEVLRNRLELLASIKEKISTYGTRVA